MLFVVFRLLRDPEHRRAQIDALVYELYELTDEEIAIVERVFEQASGRRNSPTLPS